MGTKRASPPIPGRGGGRTKAEVGGKEKVFDHLPQLLTRGRSCVVIRSWEVSCDVPRSVLVVMKVQCDVCKGDDGAAVFCCADEAALCGPCDVRVHGANKLAGKHRRYALHCAASSDQLPLCDICKEKRAFLFCQEDRAILCRDCDAGIHDANDLTRKHTRFLLTGIKLSPCTVAAAPSDASSSSDRRSSSVVASSATKASSADEGFRPVVSNGINQSRRCETAHGPLMQQEGATAVGIRTTDNKKKTKEAPTFATGFSKGEVAAVAEDKGPCRSTNTSVPADATGGGSSSISEYLMKELPGWHFEDLILDSGCPHLHPATFVECLTPFWDPDLDDAAVAAGAAYPVDDGGKLPASWCVPRVPQFSPLGIPGAPPAQCYHHQRQAQHQQQGLAAMGLTGGELMTQLPARQLQHHSWTADDGFTVPDLADVPHHATSYKRPRHPLLRVLLPDAPPTTVSTAAAGVEEEELFTSQHAKKNCSFFSTRSWIVILTLKAALSSFSKYYWCFFLYYFFFLGSCVNMQRYKIGEIN